MLQRGIDLGGHLGEALVDDVLHAFQHILGAEGTHVLHFVGEDGVLERNMRHAERAGLALVGDVLHGRGATRGGLHQGEVALALLDHDRGGGDALLAEQTELADPAGHEGHLVDGVGQRHHGEGAAGARRAE
jgi:hypothetical protein